MNTDISTTSCSAAWFPTRENVLGRHASAYRPAHGRVAVAPLLPPREVSSKKKQYNGDSLDRGTAVAPWQLATRTFLLRRLSSPVEKVVTAHFVPLLGLGGVFGVIEWGPGGAGDTSTVARRAGLFYQPR